MAQLQSTNVVGTLCVNGVAVGGGKDFKLCCITTTGNFTPTSDLVDGDGHVEAVLVGGGGGSGIINSRSDGLEGFLFTGAGGGAEVKSTVYQVTSSAAHYTIIGAGGSTGSLFNCSTAWEERVDPSEGGITSINGPKYIQAEGGGAGHHTLINACNGQRCIGTKTKNGGQETLSAGGPVPMTEARIYAQFCCYAGQTGDGRQFFDCIRTLGDQPTVTYDTTPGAKDIVTASLYSNVCGFTAGKGVQTPFGEFGVGGQGYKSLQNLTSTVNAASVGWSQDGNNVVSGSNGYVCGGGGGSAIRCTYVTDPYEATGGEGADGVIILKWYE